MVEDIFGECHASADHEICIYHCIIHFEMNDMKRKIKSFNFNFIFLRTPMYTEMHKLELFA